MLKPLSALIALLCCLQANAQQWAKPGAQWTFGTQHAVTGDIDYIRWNYVGDSLINGHLCSVIQGGLSAGQGEGDIIRPMITYEDGGIVYLYNPAEAAFTTLYDFNQVAGGGWTTRLDSCDVRINVDSVGVMMIGGQSRKTLYLNTTSSWYLFKGWAVEGIGSLVRPYPYVLGACYGMIVDEKFYYTTLRCYQDDATNNYHFPGTPDCEYEALSSPVLVEGSEIRIYPNPVGELLHLSTSRSLRHAVLSITDLRGRMLLKQALKEDAKEWTLSLKDLSPGIYLYSLSGSDAVVRRGKFVRK